MGYLKRPIRRSRARRQANALRDVAPIDPAKWTPYRGAPDWPNAPYLRFMAEHPEWFDRQGIFQAAADVIRDPETSAAVRKRVSVARNAFSRKLPAPDWRDFPPAAIFWFVNASEEMRKHATALNNALIEAGCLVFVSVCDNPGIIKFRDEFQVAAIPFSDRDDPATFASEVRKRK